MKTEQKRVGVTDIILLVLSALFAVGIRTFFKTCGPMEDGSWMTCHWAGEALTGIACVQAVIAVIHLAVRDPRVKTGTSLAMLPVAGYAALLPGHLIHLCMMDSMQCRAVTQPAVLVLSILTAVTAVADIVLRRR